MNVAPGLTRGVPVFSQYIETRYATRLLAAGAPGVGDLLRDRVADVAGTAAELARSAAWRGRPGLRSSPLRQRLNGHSER
jgi:hypothetical protein